MPSESLTEITGKCFGSVHVATWSEGFSEKWRHSRTIASFQSGPCKTCQKEIDQQDRVGIFMRDIREAITVQYRQAVIIHKALQKYSTFASSFSIRSALGGFYEKISTTSVPMTGPANRGTSCHTSYASSNGAATVKGIEKLTL